MKTCALFVDENGEISVGYDKESAIRCKDQEQAASVILYNNTHTVKKANIKPGTYPIPGWRFEVKKEDYYIPVIDEMGVIPQARERDVAILIKESEKEQQREKLIEIMKADQEAGMYEKPDFEKLAHEWFPNDSIAAIPVRSNYIKGMKKIWYDYVLPLKARIAELEKKEESQEEKFWTTIENEKALQAMIEKRRGTADDDSTTDGKSQYALAWRQCWEWSRNALNIPNYITRKKDQ